MDLNQFFSTARELNRMVDWKPDAPVDEFWESWNNAAQEVTAIQSENERLRALIADLKLGAECYITAVSDMAAGYTGETHPDWNAVQYLAGEANAAILRAAEILHQ